MPFSIAPPGLIKYDYGPGSFERHCKQAKNAGARLEVCERGSVALDIDLPEDLELAGYELLEINQLNHPINSKKGNVSLES